MLDFPNSPTAGQVFTVSNATWTFDGVKWTAGTSVMPMNDNRIINGDMRIDQRNNGASGTVINVYTIDRWQFSATQAGKMTWGRNEASITGPPGFPYNLGVLNGSAYTLVAGDYFNVNQTIEADMVSDFAWGTANAQPVTLSFWAYCNVVSGTLSGSIRNAANTRSYPFTYSVPAAGTWYRIVIIIPGDTAGTWVMSGAAASLMLTFSLGAGTTFSGPANVWASANYAAATGAVSCLSATSGGLWVTGVKLEIGSVATAYNRQSLAKSTADCQRYYSNTLTAYMQVNSAAGQAFIGTVSYPMTMRATPSITFGTVNYFNASGITIPGTPTVSAVGIGATATAAGLANFNALTVILAAEL